MPTEISAASARRIAVAAQGLAAPRPGGRVDARHLRRVFDTVGVVQIDSVNVLVRSQELPLFARLGDHPRDLIPRAVERGDLYEYWCHAASLLPIDHHPLSRVRMRQAAEGDRVWAGVRDTARRNSAMVRDILERVNTTPEGIVAGEVSTRTSPKGQWWDWDKGKTILEWLFWTGQVTARRRERDFARVYMGLHHAFPAEVLARPVPDPHDAMRAQLLRAAASHGVATASDLLDYHHLRGTQARAALTSLVEDGSLTRVSVEGWREAAYIHPGAARPRSVRARALLSPFDSMVWTRPRNERLFGFEYRIEIYTPAPKRKYGYYVLPFLLDDRLAARVDLKADRHRSVLMVPGAFSEHDTDAPRVADELAHELVLMARWLGLDSVEVGRRGDLAVPLRKRVAAVR
ncbi:MAG: winged helix-turn-helix domain-containing protein [Acidimicrobiales bacterium]